MGVYRIRLSKFLSFILRHSPDKYDLSIDKNGYAEVDSVINILKPRFKNFKKEDLFELVKDDPKGRFEISGSRIRATYGHSINVVPRSESVEPPEILYHGTSKESAGKIIEEGLSPMDRQFVHLSVNEQDAYAVGSRHTEEPVILRIMARKAASEGIVFYKEGKLFLAKYIPKGYISVSGKHK